MSWKIVNTDPGPHDSDWSNVQFGTEQAARSHAKFLNEEEARKNEPV